MTDPVTRVRSTARRPRGDSLRGRLAGALFAVLAPFMVTMPVGFFYLLPAMVAPTEAIVAEVMDEMEPVRHLQLSLLTATWGHPVGDEVLRVVAQRILGELRPADRAARYGGEEFAVLLIETDVAGAVACAERIRAAIAAVPVADASGQAVSVTASIGVAAHRDPQMDEQALIAAADRNLYAAKGGGRNRVVADPQG